MLRAGCRYWGFLFTFAPLMKILILSKKFPYPLREGEPIAITYLSWSLHQLGASLTLLAMNTTKAFFPVEELPATYNHFDQIHTVTVDNRISARGALNSLVRGDSYILSRFKSTEFAAKLKKLLTTRTFDIVQIETPYLAHYIPLIRQYSQAKIAMRAHNVEHEIWQRVANNSRSFFRKWYLRQQNARLKKFEIASLEQYDMLVAITQRDLDVFKNLGYRNASVVAPVGIDAADYRPDFKAFNKEVSLAFIGALDWMPNQEGVVWLLGEVWPALRDEFPGLSLEIAGKNTPGWLRKRQTEGVRFLGEVESAVDFINRHQILVAPLFSGSGIKVKVLEGMALGRVVITTPIGAEGIPATHREHLLIATNPAEFRDAVKFCMENPERVSQISKAARQFIKDHFDSRAIAARVLDSFEKIIAAG
jgi:glycosyltransferase involved in cell wall biosynthesis